MILWVVFFESHNEREFVTGFCPCEIVLVGIFIGLKPSGSENCGRTAVMIIQLIFFKDVNVNSWLY